MSLYFLHKGPLKHLRLIGPEELERNVTRLSFYTLPQLRAFFKTVIPVIGAIGWENESEFPEEAEDANSILLTMSYRPVDRDEMLMLLGQLVTPHNTGKLLEAMRKQEAGALKALAIMGVMKGANVLKFFGPDVFAEPEGLTALCRAEGEGVSGSLQMPDVLRHAMGVDLRGDASESAREEKVEQSASVPSENEILAMMPEAVARVVSACNFLMRIYSASRMNASAYKSMAAQGPLFEFPVQGGKKTVKPLSNARIFASVLQNLPPSRRTAEAFPEFVRDITENMSNQRFLGEIFRDAFKSGEVTASDINYAGLAEIMAALMKELSAFMPGKWYSVDSIVAVLKASFNGRLFARWSVSLYDRRRYVALDGDPWERAGVPAVKFVLAVLSLYGIVDLGVKTLWTQTVRTQYDSVQSVRVTALGHYALDPEAEKPEGLQSYVVPSCRLDEEYPFIYVPESVAGLYGPYVSKFGKAIGPTRYAVSVETFLGGLSSYTELEERIRMFRGFVDDKIPTVWQELLERVRRRSQGVKAIGQYLCLKLDMENAELMNFVRSDADVRRLCVRGEGGMLFVDYKDYEVLRMVLARAGFFFR
ncbi:MAG: hypothetical protein K2L96_07235 [Muribaculaceae bacterium]|nr:hypothetical protein [Muribaculaceae bacterium]